jgi:DNA-binding transcriptional LysR family regulator
VEDKTIMSINELRSITTFVRTVELGSLSKAATAQQISPQAASKALGQLEQYLGVRLFHRTTRKMSLTEEGMRFFEGVQPSLIGLHQSLEAARQTGDELAGPLRIVGPRTVLLQVIGPVLDEYCRHFPEVQPDVQLDDRVRNWVEDRVDVGFRLGNPPADGLIARRLFPMQLLICAAPAYLHKYGFPKTLHDLDRHRCSAFRPAQHGHIVPWRVRVGDNIQDHHVRPAFCTNDEAFELQALLAGEVIGQIAVPSAAALIRSGRLVPLLLAHMVDNYSLFLYYGSRTAQPARVRRFIDLVIEQLTNNQHFVLTRDEILAAHARGISALA